MIPHRMLSNEIFANGLKSRVSACRKRLRLNRPTQRAQVTHRLDDEGEQVFPEASLLMTDMLDDYPAGRRSVIHLECSAGFADTEASNGKMLLPVEEQEVGIT